MHEAGSWQFGLGSRFAAACPPHSMMNCLQDASSAFRMLPDAVSCIYLDILIWMLQEYVEQEDEFDIQDPSPDAEQASVMSDGHTDIDIDVMDEVR